MNEIVYSEKLEDSADIQRILEKFWTYLEKYLPEFKKGDTVFIKPNFVAPYALACTDLEIIKFVAEKIRALGAMPIVGETSGFEFDTGATFKVLNIAKFSKENAIPFYNLEEHKYRKVSIAEGIEVEISALALDARFIINLPVLKGHSITRITGAVKNLYGLLSLDSRRWGHCHNLNEVIHYLGKYFRDKTVQIVDARNLLTRAVFGELQPLGYMLCGNDAFSLDHFGSGLLNYNPEDILYLGEVEDYKVEGVVPQKSGNYIKENIKKKVHRMLYAFFYYLDLVKVTLFRGDSLLPLMHWHLGIHPKVKKNVSKEDLQRLNSVCPVKAFDLKKKKIIKKKCIKVRCLNCYRESPELITFGGLNAPKNSK